MYSSRNVHYVKMPGGVVRPQVFSRCTVTLLDGEFKEQPEPRSGRWTYARSLFTGSNAERFSRVDIPFPIRSNALAVSRKCESYAPVTDRIIVTYKCYILQRVQELDVWVLSLRFTAEIIFLCILQQIYTIKSIKNFEVINVIFTAWKKLHCLRITLCEEPLEMISGVTESNASHLAGKQLTNNGI